MYIKHTYKYIKHKISEECSSGIAPDKTAHKDTIIPWIIPLIYQHQIFLKYENGMVRRFYLFVVAVVLNIT